MKFTDRIRSLYRHENTTIQEKASSLFILDSLLCIGFLILGGIRLADGSLALGLGEVLVSIVLAFFVFGLLKGKFRIVSIGTIVLFSLAAAALFLLRDIVSGRDIYIQSTYMIPAFITVPLLAYTLWQVLGVILFGVLVHVGEYLLRVRPIALGSGGDAAFSEFLISLFLMVFSGLFIYQIFRMQQRSLKNIEERAAKADEQYRRLTRLFESTGDAFNLGERLQDHSRNNAEHAESMSKKLEEMNRSIETLNEGIGSTSAASGDIETSKESMRENMQRQTDAVEETSAAIEEIGAQSKSIAESAETKNEMIQELVQKAEEGAKQLDRSVKTYDRIEESSQNMLEVIKLIEDIADRTNLLAMNAAIEAAHAGDSGRGFAVVASEIRGLAKEANDNSRSIRTTLEENRELIRESVEISGEMQRKFREVIDTISEVRDALKEMIASFAELEEGHGKIRETMENLSEIHQVVNDSLGSMERNIASGMTGIRSIETAVKSIRGQIEELNGFSGSILSEADNLEKTGEENIENFRGLQEEMRNLSGEQMESE